MIKKSEKVEQKKFSKEQKEFEAKRNIVGFFDLLLKIALREKIDIGQFNNDKNNQEKYD